MKKWLILLLLCFIPVIVYGKFQYYPLENFTDGLNSKIDPTRIGLAEVQATENMLFNEIGCPQKRNFGISHWSSIPSGNEPTFGYTFKRLDGTIYFIVSDGYTIWATQDSLNYDTLITGLDNSYPIEAAVYFNLCWIVNGSNSNMYTDGDTIYLCNGVYTGIDDTVTPDIPICKHIAVSKNVIFMGNTAAAPSRIYFSELAKIPYKNDAWIRYKDIIPDDGEEIRALVPYNRALIIFKDRHLYPLFGED